MRAPADTDQAQYSLPFPLAAAILHGEVGMAQVDGAGLSDEAVLKLSHAIELVEDESMSARFPGERMARVVIGLSDGRVLDSGILAAPAIPRVRCPTNSWRQSSAPLPARFSARKGAPKSTNSSRLSALAFRPRLCSTHCWRAPELQNLASGMFVGASCMLAFNSGRE